jgi:putative transposase
VWARLRVREVRTSMRRVLRLMRDNDLLAPQRQPQPVEPKRHDGTILAERPNQMWGIDATVGFTVAEGRVAIFAMVDHATAECLGIHVAKRGTRFEALEPVRQAVREQFGGFAEGVACGVRLRHDHGSQFMSDDFQAEIAFLGIASSRRLCPGAGRQRLHRAILPHPQGTAALGERLHHAGGAGRSA